jgi:hypothetical protein
MREMAERLLLTIWIGSMWTVGYLVAPTLFAILDDRALAGSIAGHLFTITSYLGLICGGLLLLDLAVQHGKSVLQQWRGALLAGMLLIICIGQFVLQPKMAGLREAGLDGVNAAAFARLHGTASVLFLMNSLGGLALILFGVRVPNNNAT